MNRSQRLAGRFGKFRISNDLLTKDREGTMTRIMGMLIVVRAEHLFHTDCIEYVAYSYKFRQLEEGEITPEYQIAVLPDGDIQFIEHSRGSL